MPPLMGGALNSQILIPDRPVTQQGLGGMNTGVKGTSNAMVRGSMDCIL